MAKTNIVLIGMPASGKSTVGVVLAKILGLSFLDLDITVQNHMGVTLQKVIDERGPGGFIEVENSVLSGLDCSNTVLATGGSAVYSDEAMRHLSEQGLVVYLKISYEGVKERIGDLDARGVVMRNDSVRTLRDLYDERLPLYEKYAEITVDVDGLQIGESAVLVADTVRSYDGWDYPGR